MTQLALDSIQPPTPTRPASAPANNADDGRFAERLATAAEQRERAEPARDSEAAEQPPADEQVAVDSGEQQGVESQAQEVDESPDEDSQDGAEQTPVVAEVKDQLLLSDEAQAVESEGEAIAEIVEESAEPTAETDQDTAEPQPSESAKSDGDQQATTALLPETNPPEDGQADQEAAEVQAETPEEPGATTEQAIDQQATPEAEPEAEPVAHATVVADKPHGKQRKDSPSEASPEGSKPVESKTAEVDSATPDAPRLTEPTGQPSDDSQPRDERTASEADNTINPEPVADDPLPEDAPKEAADSKPQHNSDTKHEPVRQDAPRSIERVADRLTAARSAEQPTLSPEQRVDAARFVGRVSRAFESAQQRGDVVRLRLSPPELGAMQIKLSVTSEGAMHASVETETAAARNVLLDNLPALRERLAGMEIRVEKFDVNVGQQGQGQPDWTAGEDPGGQPRQPTRNAAARATAESETTTTAAPPTTRHIGPDQINLVA